MKKIMGTLLLATLLLSGCQNNEHNTENEYSSYENKTDVEEQSSNLENAHKASENTQMEESDSSSEGQKSNDGEDTIAQKEDVTLVSLGKTKNGAHINGMKLSIGGKEKQAIHVSSKFSYGGRLELRDLDSDDLKDIIVYEMIGGSGNLQNIYIFKRRENGVTPIMSPENYVSQKNYYANYLGEGIVRFEDKNTGFKTTYNLDAAYETEGFTLEEAQKRFGMGELAWVDPYSEFSLVDIDEDGLIEVRAQQIICGIAHVDVIGEMGTYYKLVNDTYVPIATEYYKVSHKDWKKEKLGKMDF